MTTRRKPNLGGRPKLAPEFKESERIMVNLTLAAHARLLAVCAQLEVSPKDLLMTAVARAEARLRRK